MLGKLQNGIVRCFPTQKSSQADQPINKYASARKVKPPIEGCEADPDALRADLSFLLLLSIHCLSSPYLCPRRTLSLPALSYTGPSSLVLDSPPKIALAVPLHISASIPATPAYFLSSPAQCTRRQMTRTYGPSMRWQWVDICRAESSHRGRKPIDANVENQLNNTSTVAAQRL
jgi:hypothetical protein